MSEQELREWFDAALKFHGHKCSAMPLGLRAGLAAMEKLGVERATNQELHCVAEAGPMHPQMCFVDGVMMATGCTYGKGNMERLNYSKNAFTLIETSTKRAVRVAVNGEFQEADLGSKFVEMRTQGVEPKDVPAEVIDPLIENILQQPNEVMLDISEVFEADLQRMSPTFEWHKCAICGEVVFADGLRIKDGKMVCMSCLGK